MKNKFILLPAVLAFTLAGCADDGELTIYSPTGAPAVAFYNYGDKSNFETNNDSSVIMSEMVAGKKDVVVLPTNVGVNAIVKQNAPYKIAATITFGNIYVAKTGNDDDGVMDKDDYIVLFQQNSIPDLLFHSVHGNDLNEGIHYVENAQFAAQCLKTGKDVTKNNEPVDYVLIAEPAFTTVKGDTRDASQYENIQDSYFAKYSSQIFQASIFVKNNANKSKVNEFLTSIKTDIENGIANPDLIKEGMAKNEKADTFYGVKPEMAAKVTKSGNKMGLGFKLAHENKEGIDKFLSIFNIGETSQDIYYK